jgi:hypothetical protein
MRTRDEGCIYHGQNQIDEVYTPSSRRDQREDEDENERNKKISPFPPQIIITP